MTRYECGSCGQLANLAGVEQREFVQECPACGERTTWTIAFEGDGLTF